MVNMTPPDQRHRLERRRPWSATNSLSCMCRRRYFFTAFVPA